MRRALSTLLLLAGAAVASSEDFAGDWEVKLLIKERDGFPWSREVTYPRSMTLEIRDGRLVGNYTDQYDHSCAFTLVSVLNEGRDLVLAGCGETKSADGYAPIHHAKLREGKLHAIVTTNEKLFEWIAVRRK